MAEALDPQVDKPLVAALLRFARVRGALIAELPLRDLFARVADATGEPHIGLRLASEQQLSPAYGALERELRSGLTVLDVLRCLARHAALIHPEMTAELRVDEAFATWVQRLPAAPGGFDPHAEEYGLAFVIARCREACASHPIAVTSVSWSRPRPRDVVSLQRFFGSHALHFGAETSEFTLARTTLDAPLARHFPRERTADVVAAKLPDLLPDHATLDRVADALAVSPRTLQRRLEEEQTSFLEVLDGVRESLARSLLGEDALTLVDVAERLGFSDLATFSRAFKRWTGLPPGTYRSRARPPT